MPAVKTIHVFLIVVIVVQICVGRDLTSVYAGDKPCDTPDGKGKLDEELSRLPREEPNQAGAGGKTESVPGAKDGEPASKSEPDRFEQLLREADSIERRHDEEARSRQAADEPSAVVEEAVAEKSVSPRVREDQPGRTGPSEVEEHVDLGGGSIEVNAKREGLDFLGDWRFLKRKRLERREREAVIDFLTGKAVWNPEGAKLTPERALEVGLDWASQFENYPLRKENLKLELKIRKIEFDTLKSLYENLRHMSPEKFRDEYSKKGYIELGYPDVYVERTAADAKKLEQLQEWETKGVKLKFKGAQEDILSAIENKMDKVKKSISDLDRADKISIGTIHQNELAQVHAIRRLRDVADALRLGQIRDIQVKLEAVAGDVHKLTDPIDQIRAVALSVNKRLKPKENGEKSEYRTPDEYAERYNSASLKLLDRFFAKIIPPIVSRAVSSAGRKFADTNEWFNHGPGKSLEPYQKNILLLVFAKEYFWPIVALGGSGVYFLATMPWHSKWEKEKKDKEQYDKNISEESGYWGELKNALVKMGRMKTEADVVQKWQTFNRSSWDILGHFGPDEPIRKAEDFFDVYKHLPDIVPLLKTFVENPNLDQAIQWGSPTANEKKIVDAAMKIVESEIQDRLKNYSVFQVYAKDYVEPPNLANHDSRKKGNSFTFIKTLTIRLLLEAKFQVKREADRVSVKIDDDSAAVNASPVARQLAQDILNMKAHDESTLIPSSPNPPSAPAIRNQGNPIMAPPLDESSATQPSSRPASSAPATTQSAAKLPTYAEFMDNVVGRLYRRYGKEIEENKMCMLESFSKALDSVPPECLIELSETNPNLALSIFASRTVVGEVLAAAKKNSIPSKGLSSPSSAPSSRPQP